MQIPTTAFCRFVSTKPVTVHFLYEKLLQTASSCVLSLEPRLNLHSYPIVMNAFSSRLSSSSPDEPALPSEGASLLTITFLRLRGRLQALAARFLGNRMEAEDVVYEAFCRLWQKERLPGSEADREALITTTVRHLSLDAVRRQTVRRAVSIDDVEPVVLPIEDLGDERDEREIAFNRVWQLASEHLTVIQMDILRRRDMEGAAYADIAAALSMSETAVRMQLSRARKVLRTLYRHRFSNGSD